MLRSEGKTILIDTGVGNDRERPHMPLFDHLHTDFLDRLAQAGVRPEDVDIVVVATPNGTTSEALVVADLAHVAWAVNLGCLGFHVWPSTAADPAHTDELRIDRDFQDKLDVHIHLPEGATPKDGPSAGITMACAMASALSNRPVRHDIAMSGEVTLRGRVLPVGGVKEKVLAAHRAGIMTVILPQENRKDLEEVPSNIRDEMTVSFVSHMDEVLGIALVKEAPEDLVGLPVVPDKCREQPQAVSDVH